MMHFFKQTGWFCFFFIFAQSVQALAILEKLDQAAELNKLSVNQRHEGRHQLILMLTRCEFAEPCLIQMIDDLKVIEDQTHNPMYLVYRNYLTSKKSELTEQAKRCDIPAKREVRKMIADCLKEMDIKEVNAQDLNRNKIDQIEDERDICIKNNVEQLAENGNLFAQAVMVNIYERSRNNAKMDHWYNEMQKKANTKEFATYLSCPDIP